MGQAVPKVLNQAGMLRLLEQHGWRRTIGGKHNVKTEKPGERPITLPMHHGNDYGPDLTARILREAGIVRTR